MTVDGFQNHFHCLLVSSVKINYKKLRYENSEFVKVYFGTA